MSFNWEKAKQEALRIKIYRAKLMAKGQINSDFDKNHAPYVRDAQKNNYTLLVKDVTDQVKKEQELAITRRLKRIGK